MSAAHMGMVLAADGLDGNEKLLLMALTNYTDPHGYCWPSEARLVADCGTSRSTVQRVKRMLTKRGLLKSVRRTNPTTGDPISNLTRVNLPLLASMARSSRQYSDNLIEAITFADDSQGDPARSLGGTPDAPEPSDLLLLHDGADPGSSWSRPRVKMEPTPSHVGAQSLIDPVENPSPLPAVVEPARPVAAVQGGGGDSASPEEQQQAAAFVDALPYDGRLPGRKDRDYLTARVAAAFGAGWSERVLRRQLTAGTDGAKSLVAVYRFRLGEGELPDAPAAVVRPAQPVVPAPAGEVIPPNEEFLRQRKARRGQRLAARRG